MILTAETRIRELILQIDESKETFTFDPGYTDPTKGAGQYLTNLQNIYQGEGGLIRETT